MKEQLYRSIAIGLFIMLLLASISLFLTKAANERLTVDNARFKKNIDVLNKDFKAYKTIYGHSAAKVEALTYTTGELKAYQPATVAKIKEVKSRPKDVISVTDVGFTAWIDTTVPVVKTDTSICFNYTDKYFDVVGCYYPGDTTANIAAGYTDSLTIIPTRVPYRFWFIRYGCKAVELNVIAGNKAAVFNYLKYIELKK